MYKFKYCKPVIQQSTEQSLVDFTHLVEFFTTIPGSSHILVFILGFSIPSILAFWVAKKVTPGLKVVIDSVKDNLKEVNEEISSLSKGIQLTSENIKSYSYNLRETSENATYAFKTINDGLILTNRHISNLDTSLDVVKDAVNSNHHSLDKITDSVSEIKSDVRDIRFDVKRLI